MQIKIDILHILSRNLDAVMAVSDHLGLSFGHFQRIAVVGDSQIGGEAQFDGQVGVLGFVTRYADIGFPSLLHVVQSSGDPIFGIVAPSGQFFQFGGVECHHLPHPYVAQRNAYVDDQIFRSDIVGIPFRNGISGGKQRIAFSVVKLVSLLGIGDAQTSFGFYACDGLVVQHPSVITEKGAVLFGDIDQVGGKSTGSGSALGIEGGVASSCVGMTATAGGSGIQGAFTSLKGIVSTDPGIVV